MEQNDSWSAISDQRMQAVTTGLLDRTLPAAQWTHEAHLMVGLQVLRHRPETNWSRYLPGIIWRYNEATGTPNTDERGYHETITQFYLLALGAVLDRLPRQLPISDVMRRVLRSRFAARDFSLDYWSRERLHSVQARRVWLDPDLQPLDFSCVLLESG